MGQATDNGKGDLGNSHIKIQTTPTGNLGQGDRKSKSVSSTLHHKVRSLPSDFTMSNSKGWIRTFSSEREKPVRERKGWMIIIYDLSGSGVVAASMITPFVPSPGSDRVSRSNPGAWLILRPNGPSVSNWKPWGRLEAWRERGPVDGLGYKFTLVTDSGLTSGVPIAEGTMSVRKGGEFCIDSARKDSGLSLLEPVRGFVMGSSVEAEGKMSKPMVKVGLRHVTCMADAALFVALQPPLISVWMLVAFFHKSSGKSFALMNKTHSRKLS
ncbi:hypothetical protein ACH5RR_004138 [Cinchona calisaya]|uniref:Uncharacterized protein n=1 Tax=Cinchona calisaya TaxID=153742 RepID=A0ABD3AXK8_9GENT